MIYKLHFGKSYNRLEFGFDKDYERIRIYKTQRELSKAIKRVNQFKCVEWSDTYKLKEVA